MIVKSRLEEVPELDDCYVLWALSTIKAVIDLEDTAVYNAIHKHGFPLPLKIGKKSMWRKSDVLKWIDSRKQELSNSPIRKES